MSVNEPVATLMANQIPDYLSFWPFVIDSVTVAAWVSREKISLRHMIMSRISLKIECPLVAVYNLVLRRCIFNFRMNGCVYWQIYADIPAILIIQRRIVLSVPSREFDSEWLRVRSRLRVTWIRISKGVLLNIGSLHSSPQTISCWSILPNLIKWLAVSIQR